MVKHLVISPDTEHNPSIFNIKICEQNLIMLMTACSKTTNALYKAQLDKSKTECPICSMDEENIAIIAMCTSMLMEFATVVKPENTEDLMEYSRRLKILNDHVSYEKKPILRIKEAQIERI